MRSSTTSVPNTIPAQGLSLSFMSSYDFSTTIVDDIDSRPPRKMLSMAVQPSACPATKPSTNTPRNLLPAVTRALLPTFRSFLKLNSRPRPNIRKMMPISDHWCTVSSELMPGNQEICGPTRKPAMM